MQTTTQVSLKQLLIDAFNKRQEAEQQNRQEWLERETEKTEKEFEYRFGFKPVSVSGRLVQVDGITLVRNGNNEWAISGHCPNCGAEVTSRYVYDLADLGQYLVEFRADSSHFCPVNVVSNDNWQHRLAEAIVEAIQENMAR